MEPFYFGTPPALRFGVYHSAPAGPTGAVLLCPPIGHEYVRAHRALRNLAVQLGRNGAAVLRFDYLGTGDSSGDMIDASVGQWVADINEAADQLRQRSGASRVCLVGLRFGAALAVLASHRRDDVERVVLWDPALHGPGYLDELAALQRAWLNDRLAASADRLGVESELVGMPVTDALRREIGAVDVAAGPPPPVAALDVVTSSPRPDCADWVRRLAAQGRQARYHEVSSAGDWGSPEAVHQLLLPHEILRHLSELIVQAPAAPR